MKEKKVGETQISAKKLAKQQASDSRDLVRYETGITVVETGRTGASGYAVRGVDENRVGIMVDGLRQAETLSSQGFKELFEGYGNFNNTRNSIEIENVKTATITKGADSLKSGSGALGGSVIFETKDARDYLLDKDYYLSYKRGYQTMNNQNLKTLTLAGRSKKFDILVVDTKRDGHEIENYDYKIYPNKQADLSAVGPKREKADPYQITRQSTLIKLGFQPNENHRLSVALDDSTLETKGMDLSYIFNQCKNSKCEDKYGERVIHDQSKRKNIQFSYENFTQTPFWDHIKLSYSSQKITNKARSDEYCHQSTCNGVLNPQGLHLVEEEGVYKIKDKYNQDFQYEKDDSGWYTSYELRNSKKEKISDGVQTEGNPLDSVLIDCEKLNCKNKFRVYQEKDENWDDSYKYEDREITIKKLPNGKKYGEISLKEGKERFLDQLKKETARFLFPKSFGYSTDSVNDRDLNTNTQQIKLDLDKEFSLWHTQHSLKYGGFYEKTLKSMVNHQYNTAANVQWWADYFFCARGENGNIGVEKKPQPNISVADCAKGEPLHSDKGKETYLIPVTTKNNVLYFGDNVQLTSWLGLDLNYRYDHVKYLPSYDEKIPVPNGLITGLFKKFGLKDYVYGKKDSIPRGYEDCTYTTDCYKKNFQDNLALLLRKTDYKHHSYNLGLNLDPTDWLRVQLKYANGFRAPTSDEIYMTFKHPQFSIQPNTDLKAETSKTKEVAFTFYKNSSYITLNAFQNDYRNFIDLVEVGPRPIEEGSTIPYPFHQNQNRDRARVRGIEIASRLEMGDLFEKLQGFHLGYKFTYQKGRIKDNGLNPKYKEFLDLNKTEHPEYEAIARKPQPMNALQPTTSVYNIGYDAPSQKWGMDVYITNVAAKKAKDSFNSQWTSMVQRKEKQYTDTPQNVPATKANGKDVKDSRGLWRNNRYTVIDTIAYWKPIKNLTFTAGVYNLTNKKYLTWDSARSIRHLGTINRVETATGKGLNRFYAPGRNYRMSVQFEF
ncbi:TonB-dependent receptor domain-containing protein [Haemophilus influenzae]|uniref:TonB-dependent receptor domain-containing protein n=1 Tax=Haemophilus influenzae TaxID=727 RepID=UPI000CFFBEB7|nr:TonB-dependent receptor [Haemophilus influenzae]PRJ44901.1 putative hemoglobin and hemoglobin-haptoglobin-binding protein 3 precursor [Haemophilus influenzae]PRL87409.1 putative hemoglobin and hemoglobin-haptoglobin-binding protein 3 precursor [Haemophilus influenzae]PRM43993.1 putative hemoglobin and hemoglobin-haptoglobin-binding protein 3 precursor [Haemophilus influenzae]PRM44908.1 putative hemoglobin and hemoglobin-haptoglobin-binding protein 3 precursor [Haemophilus influenzae]